jgi:low temperature requirement protein LtrA
MPAKDVKQLNMLATLHYAYGVLLAIGALCMLMVLMAGIKAEFGSALEPQGVYESHQQISWGPILISFGAIGFVGSVLLTAATMRAARRLENQARRGFCIVVAAINSLSVPLGTVLGIVTIVTLMRPSVMQLFDQGPGDGPRGGIAPTSHASE